MQLTFIKTLDIVNIEVERVKYRDFKPFFGPRLADKRVLYAYFSGDTSLYAFLSDLAKQAYGDSLPFQSPRRRNPLSFV